MRFLFTSYVSSPEFSDPNAWLERIEGYTGILDALAKSHEVFSIEHISYEGIIQRNSVNYRFVNRGKRFHRSPAQLHRLIRELRPDVVFINGFNFPIQIIYLKMMLGTKTRIIVLHRADKPFAGIKKWFQKLANYCVDAYLFASKEFARDWKGIINVAKIYEVVQASSVFYITDRKVARKKLFIPENELMFLWVGALIDRKDPIAVVKAFINFSEGKTNTKLYLIFQSDLLLQELMLIVEKENAGDRIIFIGPIAHLDLNNWYNSADFIISGSHHEGSGVSIIEAMSCGCIPVLSNITSFRRMTGPSICGLLFEPGNIDDIVEKLVAAAEIDRHKEITKVLDQFNKELSFNAIANKINCITGYTKNVHHSATTQG